MSDAQAAQATQNGVPAVEKTETPPTPGFKVFAGNLSYTTTDEGLKAFFAPVQSDILSVQVIQRGTRSAGYGFVALATEAAAKKAVESLNKQDLDGRQVIVEIAKPAEQKDKDSTERKTKRRTSRRGAKAVPGEVTEAEANGETPKAEGAAPAQGEQKPKKKRKTHRKKKSAAAPAEGEAVKETPAPAAAAEGTEAPKKTPRARKPRPPRTPRPAGEDPAGEPSKNMLFVANLGFNVDDAALGALFTDAGIPFTSARVVRRRWAPNRSKGYGFVDVSNEENQKKAIAALDGKELGDRTIAVKVAVNGNREEDKAEDAPKDAAPVGAPVAPGPAALPASSAVPPATAPTPAVAA